MSWTCLFESTYPDLRKCLNSLQQNSTNGKLHAPNKNDAGSNDWQFEMVNLFKAGKISDARKMLCGKLQDDEIPQVYRWIYDNISVFTDSVDVQDKIILLIKQGMVDHAIVADAEINLAATLIRISHLLR